MLTALAKYRYDSQPGRSAVRLAVTVGPHVAEHFSDFSSTAKAEAEKLGYDLELYVWNPEIPDARHSRILEARGVRGLILGPIQERMEMEEPQIQWEKFSVVIIGRFIAKPPLDTIFVNPFQSIRLCLQIAYDYGYKRPGLVTHERINLRTRDMLLGGFDSLMIKLPENQRVGPLISQSMSFEEVSAWVRDEEIDVIIGHRYVGEFLEKSGWSFPAKIPFIAIDKQASLTSDHRFAGTTHESGEVARIAVAVLNEKVISSKQGIPRIAKTLLLDSYWKDGETLPRVATSDP